MSDTMSKVAIIGAGAFGRALAHLAQAGGPVRLFGRRAADGVETDIASGVAEADMIILAVPAQTTRKVLNIHANSFAKDAPLVLAAKGVERGTGALQSEIAAGFTPNPIMALTGPSFAADLIRGLPTAITLAAGDPDRGEAVQHRLAGPALRPYLSDDLIGAQIGGALKNVMAIACGAAMGRGLGESARAALMTRGFAEMTRFAVARGGQAETLAGLSGLGDLALTCAGAKSRNFTYGFALGRGEVPETGVTYEGAATAGAVLALGRKMKIETPITEVVAALTAGETDVDGAMRALLNRPLTREG
ncbi:MAG: NAD(P)H-dependent glycerol-3-phosphate dehydrogenase [Pseudomonadota bacterium]